MYIYRGWNPDNYYCKMESFRLSVTDGRKSGGTCNCRDGVRRVVIKIQGSQPAACRGYHRCVQHLFLGIKIIRLVPDSLGQPVLFPAVSGMVGSLEAEGWLVISYSTTGSGRRYSEKKNKKKKILRSPTPCRLLCY